MILDLPHSGQKVTAGCAKLQLIFCPFYIATSHTAGLRQQ